MDPIAPVSATAAPRALPFGGGGLTVGQIVQARVARVDGDTVQLRWGEQSVSVPSRVPLNVGQQVNLMVEEGSAGKILLRMVDDGFGKGRPARADGSTSSRGSSGNAASAIGTRGAPAPAGQPGRPDRDAGFGQGGQGFADPQAEWGL